MSPNELSARRDNAVLQAALDQVAALAGTSKWRRCLHHPYRYLSGQFFRHMVYPFRRRGLLRRATTFFGYPLQVLLPAGMDIYLLGGKSHDTEIRLARFLCTLLRPGDTFIDVGAHFGYYSLLASYLLGPDGRVVSFEASRQTFQLLQWNTQPYAAISAHHFACADKDGTVTFFEFPALYSEYNTLFPEQFAGTSWSEKQEAKALTVESIQLDTFLDRHQLVPTLIKIDVEGAEASVIRGLERTLRAADGLHLAMEFLSDARHNRSHHAAAALLRQWGYMPHLIDAQGQLQRTHTSALIDHLNARRLESENVIFKRAQP